MTIRTVVIRGREFEGDAVRYTQDNRFVEQAYLTGSLDPDLQQAVKQYHNGTKVFVNPTPNIQDVGLQKWALKWERTEIDPEVFFNTYDTSFSEII